MEEKPDWRKSHQRIYQICLKQELDMGWSREIAHKRAYDRARRSSDRSMNAYKSTYKMVAKSYPGWSPSQIEKETKRIEKMKAMHDNSAAPGKIKHIRWTVDGDEVLKV